MSTGDSKRFKLVDARPDDMLTNGIMSAPQTATITTGVAIMY